MKKKELIVDKSNQPDKDGNHILWLHVKTEKGESWRRIFKGTRKECFDKKREILES